MTTRTELSKRLEQIAPFAVTVALGAATLAGGYIGAQLGEKVGHAVQWLEAPHHLEKIEAEGKTPAGNTLGAVGGIVVGAGWPARKLYKYHKNRTR